MVGGLKFTILTDHRALNKMETMEISNIASNRTLRAFEVILSNNIEVRHISGKENRVSDWLSRHTEGSPMYPDWPKFVQTAPQTACINILYEGTVLISNKQCDGWGT